MGHRCPWKPYFLWWRTADTPGACCTAADVHHFTCRMALLVSQGGKTQHTSCTLQLEYATNSKAENSAAKHISMHLGDCLAGPDTLTCRSQAGHQLTGAGSRPVQSPQQHQTDQMPGSPPCPAKKPSGQQINSQHTSRKRH